MDRILMYSVGDTVRIRYSPTQSIPEAYINEVVTIMRIDKDDYKMPYLVKKTIGTFLEGREVFRYWVSEDCLARPITIKNWETKKHLLGIKD